MGSSSSKALRRKATAPLVSPLPTLLEVNFSKIFHGTAFDIHTPDNTCWFHADQLFGSLSSLKFFDGTGREEPFMVVVSETHKNRFRILMSTSIANERIEYVYVANDVLGPMLWFEIDIGSGNNRHEELFEWRDVGQGNWNLIRFIKNVSTPGEVVAVWATGLPNLWGQFELRGSGAAGALGECFKLMALGSAFSIEYDKFLVRVAIPRSGRRRYQDGSGGGSGDGGGGSGYGGGDGGGGGGGDGGGG